MGRRVIWFKPMNRRYCFVDLTFFLVDSAIEFFFIRHEEGEHVLLDDVLADVDDVVDVLGSNVMKSGQGHPEAKELFSEGDVIFLRAWLFFRSVRVTFPLNRGNKIPKIGSLCS